MSDTIPTPTYPGSPLGAGYMPVEGPQVKPKTNTSNTGKLHPDYITALDRWTLCRDTTEGEDAVRLKGTLYCPKPSGQDDTEFAAFLKRASYTNAVGRARDGLDGLIHRKQAVVTAPEQMGPLLADITTTGLSMEDLEKWATHEVLTVGRGGLLVEYPTVYPSDDRSVADVEASGERAYLAYYTAENILNWREGRVKNKKQLTWLKLREWVEKGVGEDTTYVEAIREISLDENGFCVQYVYEGGKKPTVVPEQKPIIVRGKPLTYIPFKILGTVAPTMEVQKPPIYDIAVKNIHHWQLSADRRHALHWADNPTAIIFGSIISPDGQPVDVIKLGSSSILNVQIGGDAKYLEFMGNGLEPTKEQMNEDMADMAILLSRILAGDSKAAEAAETAAIHRAGENAVLADMANSISRALTEVLVILAEFMGYETKDISYRLNTNFYPTPMSSQMFIAMTNAVIAGTFSPEEFFVACVAGDMISPDKTYEQHKKELDAMPKPEAPVNKGGAINPPGGTDSKGNPRTPGLGDAKAQ